MTPGELVEVITKRLVEEFAAPVNRDFHAYGLTDDHMRALAMIIADAIKRGNKP